MNFRQTLKLGNISCSSTSKSNTSRTFFKNEFYHLKLHLVIQHSPSCMYDILVSLLPNYLCLACCYHIKTLACWASKNLGSTLSDIPCTIWRKKKLYQTMGILHSLTSKILCFLCHCENVSCILLYEHFLNDGKSQDIHDKFSSL